MRIRRFLYAAFLLLSGAAADAQTPTRLHATVDRVDGTMVQVTTVGGASVTVTLADDTRIAAMTAASLSDITPDSYVGSAAMAQPDGSLRALEVHIFPQIMRGSGEGTRPFDAGPQSSMTNGAVGSVTGTNGRTITVAYQGGQKTIVVPPDTPIVRLEPGKRTLLAPGVHVTVSGTRTADGTVVARMIFVGLHGLVPPM